MMYHAGNIYFAEPSRSLRKRSPMRTRDDIQFEITRIFREQFEIENPELDEDLRDVYEFDSIDAVDLLREIEILLDSALTRAEKKKAMEIRTIRQVLDYIEGLASTRAQSATTSPRQRRPLI
jgi:acyl carrier protein